MSNDDDNKKPDYAIGYKKPPAETKFKPGQCGNPKGRPKGSKNLTSILESEINALIPITENGKRKKISKMTAFIRQAVNKAANGDPRALIIILNEIRQREGRMKGAQTTAGHAADKNAPAATSTLTDEEVARMYMETIKNAKPAE